MSFSFYSHAFCIKIHVGKQIGISIKFAKFLRNSECQKAPPRLVKGENPMEI